MRCTINPRNLSIVEESLYEQLKPFMRQIDIRLRQMSTNCIRVCFDTRNHVTLSRIEKLSLTTECLITRQFLHLEATVLKFGQDIEFKSNSRVIQNKVINSTQK